MARQISKSDETSPLAEIFVLFALQSAAQASADAIGTSAFSLLNKAAAMEDSRIHRKNRAAGGGRKVSTDWHRRWGIEPVDAMLIFEIFRRLQVPISQAKLIGLFRERAFAIDEGPGGSDWQRNLTDQSYKRFLETPRTEFRSAYEVKLKALPDNPRGLRHALKDIAARVFEDWT